MIEYLLALGVGALVGLAIIGTGHLIGAFRDGRRQQPRRCECSCQRQPSVEYRAQTPGGCNRAEHSEGAV